MTESSASKSLVAAFGALMSDGQGGDSPSATYWSELLARGELLTAVDREESARLRDLHGCQTGECYYNAMMIGSVNKRYKVYMGYASSIIPMSHAWLVDSTTGRVVDPTWAACSKGLPEEPDYFGVEVPKEFVRRHINRRETAEDVLPYLFGLIEY